MTTTDSFTRPTTHIQRSVIIICLDHIFGLRLHLSELSVVETTGSRVGAKTGSVGHARFARAAKTRSTDKHTTVNSLPPFLRTHSSVRMILIRKPSSRLKRTATFWTPTLTAGLPPTHALLSLDIRNMFDGVSRDAARSALASNPATNPYCPLV